MQILAPLIVALVPLLITPSLLYYFDITPKVVILLLGTAGALLLHRENARNLAGFLMTPRGRWFALLIGAYWLLSVISTATSTHPSLSLNGSNWRRFGLIPETALLLFVLLAAAWLAQDPRNLRMLLLSISVSGAIGAVYGIAQYFGFDPILPIRAYQAGEGPFTIVRPPGTLGHADYFAAWLLVVVFSSLRLANRLASIVAFIAAVAIVLSGTRAALLGLVAGLLVVLISRGIRANARILALAAGVAVCIGALILTPAGLKLRARLHWSMDDARGGARLLLWRDTLRMITARPVFGFGPETFSTEFPKYESVDLARTYPDFYHESPHNMFLDTAAGQGLLSALVLAALCGLGLYAAWMSNTPPAGLVAVLISHQFTVFVPATALLFFAVVAQAFLPVGPSAPQPTRGRIAGLLVALLFTVFAVRLLIADHSLALVQRRVAAGDIAGATAAYRTAGTGSDLEYSRQMALLATRSPIYRTRMEAWQQAMDAATRATQTSEDRQNAWYNLATLLAVQNDSRGVERSLRNAIQWAPNWFKPHWTLAQLLEMRNRHEEAVSEARIAVWLDGDKDPEVVATWIKLTGKGIQ